MSEAEFRVSRLGRRCGFAVLLLSGVLWCTTTVCFVVVWDHVAAITTFPQWSWALVGGLGTMIAWRLLGIRNRLPGLLLIVWVLTTLAFADNLRSVFRGFWYGTAPAKSPPPGALRIAILNCASSAAAASEVAAYNPDVVLLQESPPSNEVARLAREWFGERAAFVVGVDCAIVSRHPLKATEERPAPHYTCAIVSLPEQTRLWVTSLRLTPPLGSMDLWRPATWRAYLEDRRLRKRQLRAVLEAPSRKPELLEVIGGDFNAPAGDGIYGLLREFGEFRDVHRVAGRGWGGTALNTLPFFRPDEIWVKGLRPIASCAVQTVHSDHRLVIADVLLKTRE